MRTKNESQKLQCAIYDFKDGMIVTKLPEPAVIREGKRKIKVDRIIARPFCDKILEMMYNSMQHTHIGNNGVEYIDTTDHEVAAFNTYLKNGVMDESYNTSTSNKCYFTQELKNEIKHLWEQKKNQLKNMKK